MIFSSEFIGQLVKSGNIEPMIGPIVGEIVNQIDINSISKFLLDEESARSLLASKIKEDPVETMKEIDKLIDLKNKKSKIQRQSQKRKVVTSSDIDSLKENILGLLDENPGIMRKDIFSSIEIPSVAAYQRAIRELREASEIYTEGENRGMTYYRT